MSTLDRCLAILRCAHTLTASGLWHAPSVRADAARACVTRIEWRYLDEVAP